MDGFEKIVEEWKTKCDRMNERERAEKRARNAKEDALEEAAEIAKSYGLKVEKDDFQSPRTWNVKPAKSDKPVEQVSTARRYDGRVPPAPRQSGPLPDFYEGQQFITAGWEPRGWSSYPGFRKCLPSYEELASIATARGLDVDWFIAGCAAATCQMRAADKHQGYDRY